MMVIPTLFGNDNSILQYNAAAVAVFTAWFTLLLICQRYLSFIFTSSHN